MLQRLLCKLDVRHKWEAAVTEDGGRYKQCAFCRKTYDHDRGHWPGGVSTGG